MIRARDDGHVSVRVIPVAADQRKRIGQVFLRRGCCRLRQDAPFRNPVLNQPVVHGLVHGLRFGDGLALAHTARDDGRALRVFQQIVPRALQPSHQCQGRLIAVNRRAQHDQIRPLRIGVGAGVADDGDLNEAEIQEAETGQPQNDPPDRRRQIRQTDAGKK